MLPGTQGQKKLSKEAKEENYNGGWKKKLFTNSSFSSSFSSKAAEEMPFCLL